MGCNVSKISPGVASVGQRQHSGRLKLLRRLRSHRCVAVSDDSGAKCRGKGRPKKASSLWSRSKSKLQKATGSGKTADCRTPDLRGWHESRPERRRRSSIRREQLEIALAAPHFVSSASSLFGSSAHTDQSLLDLESPRSFRSARSRRRRLSDGALLCDSSRSFVGSLVALDQQESSKRKQEEESFNASVKKRWLSQPAQSGVGGEGEDTRGDSSLSIVEFSGDDSDSDSECSSACASFSSSVVQVRVQRCATLDERQEDLQAGFYLDEEDLRSQCATAGTTSPSSPVPLQQSEEAHVHDPLRQRRRMQLPPIEFRSTLRSGHESAFRQVRNTLPISRLKYHNDVRLATPHSSEPPLVTDDLFREENKEVLPPALASTTRSVADKHFDFLLAKSLPQIGSKATHAAATGVNSKNGKTMMTRTQTEISL
ncbi:MAG: hypothetical protein MHM6MM_007956 [Cercozoa sp. M6MM]